jgi:hypothetical protein
MKAMELVCFQRDGWRKIAVTLKTPFQGSPRVNEC